MNLPTYSDKEIQVLDGIMDKEFTVFPPFKTYQEFCASLDGHPVVIEFLNESIKKMPLWINSMAAWKRSLSKWRLKIGR